jgi:hypothetical protein
VLVRIYPRSGEVRPLSIPRDLLVEVEPGVQDRINAAYAYRGPEQARKVVEDLFSRGAISRARPDKPRAQLPDETAAQLEGTPEILPSGVQVLIPMRPPTRPS